MIWEPQTTHTIHVIHDHGSIKGTHPVWCGKVTIHTCLMNHNSDQIAEVGVPKTGPLATIEYEAESRR